MDNIFKTGDAVFSEEVFKTILTRSNIKIERIVSSGQITPPGKWYDQETDEWVILLQGEAELSYEDNSKVKIRSGDYLMIPAHQRHRVEYTSTKPVCIWLVVHITI